MLGDVGVLVDLSFVFDFMGGNTGRYSFFSLWGWGFMEVVKVCVGRVGRFFG